MKHLNAAIASLSLELGMPVREHRSRVAAFLYLSGLMVRISEKLAQEANRERKMPMSVDAVISLKKDYQVEKSLELDISDEAMEEYTKMLGF